MRRLRSLRYYDTHNTCRNYGLLALPRTFTESTRQLKSIFFSESACDLKISVVRKLELVLSKLKQPPGNFTPGLVARLDEPKRYGIVENVAQMNCSNRWVSLSYSTPFLLLPPSSLTFCFLHRFRCRESLDGLCHLVTKEFRYITSVYFAVLKHVVQQGYCHRLR